MQIGRFTWGGVRPRRAGWTAAAWLGCAALLLGCAAPRPGHSKGTAMTATAPPADRVLRDGNRVRLAGFDRLTWPDNQENSTMRTLAVALRAVGEDVSYDYLMGSSGLAFRVQFYQPEWCPSSPHAACGRNCIGDGWAATDYEAVAHGCKPDDAEGVGRVRAAVVAEIDAGRPVIYSDIEDGLIVGYESGGQVLIGRTYFEFGPDKPGVHPVEKWPPFAFVTLRKKAQPADRRAVAVAALRRAVEMFRTPRYDVKKPGFFYASGSAAYQAWGRDLRDDARFADLNAKALADQQHHNAYIYFCLIDARTAAVTYLRSVGPLLGGQASVHAARAADLYQKLLDEVLTRPCPTEIAPMPWMLKPGQTWTPDLRRRQADKLDAALALDRQAIAELEQAVAASDAAP